MGEEHCADPSTFDWWEGEPCEDSADEGQEISDEGAEEIDMDVDEEAGGEDEPEQDDTAVCNNNDRGGTLLNSYGESGCSEYEVGGFYAAYCGNEMFDTDTFKSDVMCCGCGGGCKEGEECPDPSTFDWWVEPEQDDADEGAEEDADGADEPEQDDADEGVDETPEEIIAVFDEDGDGILSTQEANACFETAC